MTVAIAISTGANTPQPAANLNENPGNWTFHIAKCTQVLETLTFYVNSSQVTGVPVQTYAAEPDGWLTMLLPESLLTAGSNTVYVEGGTTSTTSNSVTIVQPTY